MTSMLFLECTIYLESNILLFGDGVRHSLVAHGTGNFTCQQSGAASPVYNSSLAFLPLVTGSPGSQQPGA
eukprot:scaffold120409_cov13-Tisochrysis_lutea.AAC.1